MLLLLIPALEGLAQDIGRMERVMEERIADPGDRFMGSVLVTREGETLFARSYGSLDVSRPERIAVGTRFPIASISKQFTAAAILLLEERGRLRLEDPVSRHLPNALAVWRDITLYHLLTHTSGIPNRPSFRGAALEFAPGTSFNYSNPGYVLLGEIIQQVSGQTYESFVRENLLQPLGMNDSGSATSSAAVPGGPTGHFRESGRLIPWPPYDLRIAVGAGSLFSTPRDLQRWSEGLFGGRLLTASSLGRMTTPFLSDYGLGVMIENWRGRRVVIHDGKLDGYRTILVNAPDSGLTVVVLANVDESDVWRIAGQLTAIALEAGPAIALQPRDGIVAAGREVAFEARVDGSANFQWQESRDGGTTWTNLSDRDVYGGTVTSILTLRNVGSAMDRYRYRANVTGSKGASMSRTVTLTVTATVFPGPSALAVNAAGGLLVGDASNNTVHVVDAAGRATLLAGTSGVQGTSDGEGARASFRLPAGITVDSAGNAYVADTGNSLIRRITPAGLVTTFAGSAASQGHRDGAGAEAWFNAPTGVAVDAAGNIWVADTGNSVIRRITPAGNVTTIAGMPGRPGTADGAGMLAQFNQPGALAVDATGTIHVADTLNHTIRRISSGGVVDTIAGLSGVAGSSDGTGSAALFNRPTGLAVSAAGVVYVADSGNATIRAISTRGEVTTLAGLTGISGLKDGVGGEAWLNQPAAIALDRSGGLYVADRGNAAIRRLSASGELTTMAIVAGLAPTTEPPPTSPSVPTSPPVAPSVSGSGSGGGGAASEYFLGALALAALVRRLTRGGRCSAPIRIQAEEFPTKPTKDTKTEGLRQLSGRAT